MTLDRRYDFVLFFDVRMGNPNGDPDAGNLPRVDPETMHGIVTDVCIKRKVREYVASRSYDPVKKAWTPGMEIYVKNRGILNEEHERAYKALGLKIAGESGDSSSEEKPRPRREAKPKQDRDDVEAARCKMCEMFYDVRTFGAVMSTGVNCGQVRGPVQITFARSVDPILPLDISLTRVAVTRTEDREKKETEMGRKALVPYALYRAHGFVNPRFAVQTGFSSRDLEILWSALHGGMFEEDRSSSRGEMATRGLWIFEHESSLGNAPAHALFDRISVRRRDASKPPRRFEDYEIALSADPLPKGVRLLP